MKSMSTWSAPAKINRLVRALLPYEPEAVYLFGSYARAEEDKLSDIDLVVIKPTALPFFERLREISKLLPDEIGAVDILVYTPEEFAAMRERGNAFASMISDEARLIYGKEES
jgi:predicted nucleotidyltransferase